MQTINNEEFGRFLTQLRKEKGFTQKQLAEQLYLSDKAVSKWERGLSFPDIALLIPLAKILEVTTTELLSAKRIETDMPFTAQEVESLMTKTIGLSKESREKMSASKQKRKTLFWLCVCIFSLEIILLLTLGYTLEVLFENLATVAVLMLIFGTYFTFFSKETLPSYYDENPVSFYKDGIFQLNVPWIRFNNNNWQQILKAMHQSLLCILVLFPLLYLIISYAFPLVWQKAQLILTLCSVFSMFIPMYVVAKKYE